MTMSYMANIKDKTYFPKFKGLKLYNKDSLKLYFYTINFSKDEEALCKLEMKSLFKRSLKNKCFFSNHYVNPSRSPFIKQCLFVSFIGDSLDSIINQVVSDKLHYENFKVSYILGQDNQVGFHEKRKIENLVGLNILGEAEMNNPDVLLGISNVGNRWIFGINEPNDNNWQLHNKKPYSYSNALNVRVSRAIVNIAVGNNLKTKVVDPCCGIGTVIVEALSLGIYIKGFEINPSIAYKAKKILEYFDYEDVITNANMTTIEDKFDVAIIDLPYGLFSPTTLEEQLTIINSSRRIADKIVILTFEDMDKHLLSSGFKIIEKCDISKGQFKRYLTICV
ncbi:RNA methyltransferase [Clostridium algidicarnis]|uniref:RNA methyltransferase n=1 Tax=Clostridium algidicarnis TaxID=37659 RepID=UPI000A64D7AC|nr:RNA methyltransferase [Clostridium algidicarnis]